MKHARAMATSCIFLASGCVKPVSVDPLPRHASVYEWTDGVDWDRAADEAVGVLSGYLRMRSVNPPGDETLGAWYLQDVLEQAGIPSEIFEFAPGRGSLVARVKGMGVAPPLCLLSHIDVVPAEVERWSMGPFSGEIDDEGMIWGRGALDMKSLGALELMTLVWLKRLEVPLARDVVLIAVADEEIGGAGAQLIANEHWDGIGCSHLINEGGLGLTDVLFEGQTLFGVSVAEKGNVWVRMVATGNPGHGSTPDPEDAPARLIRALAAVDTRKPKAEVGPEIRELLARAGRHGGGLTGAILRSPALVSSLQE